MPSAETVRKVESYFNIGTATIVAGVAVAILFLFTHDATPFTRGGDAGPTAPPPAASISDGGRLPFPDGWNLCPYWPGDVMDHVDHGDTVVFLLKPGCAVDGRVIRCRRR